MRTNTGIIKNTILTLLIILMATFYSFSQKSNDNIPPKSIKDKLWYGINVGNLGLGGNRFYVNLSLMGGIKLTDEFRVGAIVHGYYTYLWSRGNRVPNRNIFEYGFGGLANYTFYRNIFLQVEVDKMYLYSNYNLSNLDRKSYLFTYIGGGYKYASNSDWSFIISLMYNVNPSSNSEIFPLNYRGAFVYNF